MGSRLSIPASAQWYYVGKRDFGRAGYERAQRKFDPADMAGSLAALDVMVTGANAGLGLAVTEELARRGATVHMVCRSRERGSRARDAVLETVGCDPARVLVHEADCGLAGSLKAFAATFLEKHGKLDALVNNAGMLSNERTENTDGAESCMSVALGGTYLLTGLMLPALEAGAKAAGGGARSRVINVSSGGMYMARIEPRDLDLKQGSYDGTLQYCRSKRAQVELTEMWERRMRDEGRPVDVHSMHPGWSDTPGVRTSIPGFFKSNRGDFRTAAMGADTIVWLASSEAVRGRGGLFWLDRTAVPTHFRFAGTQASDAERQALWQACEQRYSWRAEVKTDEVKADT